MAIEKRIAFWGAGALGGAIVSGLVAAGVDPKLIYVTDRSGTRAPKLAEETGVNYVADHAELLSTAEVLILGMKPADQASALQAQQEVLARSKPLAISLAAGRSLAQIQNDLPEGVHLIRAMPNVAAQVGQSMTALVAGAEVTETELALAEEIMATFGQVQVIPEAKLAAFTAVAACSPAWFAASVDALAQAGVAAGLTKQQAVFAAAQSLLGTGQLIQELAESEQVPAQLVDRVCSPGGSTVAGLLAAESSGLRKVWQDAFFAALTADAKISRD
ncbi:pyrroline-5-carboxylate reductase [Boudabousia liubingyangii]|uniref:pyrroline-5-carboxylate reductase n=1 Tax=Boudabousia liubingyangii TaxID=1921764 RepID=UPI0009FB2967|nr:pyrroline-5-carboxylate reductase [Boudabousia liubingyangii]